MSVARKHLSIYCIVLCPAALALQRQSRSASEAQQAVAQPDYAKLHKHGWEVWKESLVKRGTQIDHFFQDQKKALKNFTDELQHAVTFTSLEPRTCKPNATKASTAYFVDNSLLQAQTNGVGYRFTKSLKDRDLSAVAHWGTTVKGTDDGDGWVQVGDCFLPTTLQGTPVVSLRALPAAH
mmetsp:Transcript_44206/g.140821  ORF Transcript_44206/g.140821 Transcript_44206/m.140821 type:complete len:180 (+) Transcript_44206:165-704(+)